MERFLEGLLQSNAFDILDSPFADKLCLDSFVRIIRNLRNLYEETLFLPYSAPLVCLAKSIYFWFIEHDGMRSVAEMHAFADFMDLNGISIAVHMVHIGAFESHPVHAVNRFLDAFINVAKVVLDSRPSDCGGTHQLLRQLLVTRNLTMACDN